MIHLSGSLKRLRLGMRTHIATSKLFVEKKMMFLMHSQSFSVLKSVGYKGVRLSHATNFKVSNIKSFSTERNENFMLINKYDDIVNHLLLHVGKPQITAIIRTIRVVLANPSNAQTVLNKKLTTSKNELKWFYGWLQQLYYENYMKINYDGQSVPAYVARDQEMAILVYDGLVNALQLTGKYEHSVLFSPTMDANIAPESSKTKDSDCLGEVKATVDEFFDKVPYSVSLAATNHINQYAREQINATQLRKSLKDCCGIHIAPLKPLLNHLGIKIDAATMVKIQKSVESNLVMHKSVMSEIKLLIDKGKKHRATQAKLGEQNGDLGMALGALSETVGSAKTSQRHFGGIHCLKVDLICSDIRSVAVPRARKTYGDVEWGIPNEASRLYVAQHVEAAHDWDGAVSGVEHFNWNTGLYDNSILHQKAPSTTGDNIGVPDDANASVLNMLSPIEYRAQYMNVASRVLLARNKNKKAFRNNSLDLDMNEELSANPVEVSKHARKVFIRNLPVMITEEGLIESLRGFGEVSNVLMLGKTSVDTTRLANEHAILGSDQAKAAKADLVVAVYEQGGEVEVGSDGSVRESKGLTQRHLKSNVRGVNSELLKHILGEESADEYFEETHLFDTVIDPADTAVMNKSESAPTLTAPKAKHASGKRTMGLAKNTLTDVAAFVTMADDAGFAEIMGEEISLLGMCIDVSD